MIQEEKELVIKDLSSRLPYNCMVSIAEGGIDGIQWTDATLNSYLLHQIMEEEAWEYVKPYLRPISSMTEEERHEYKVLSSGFGFTEFYKASAILVDWFNKNMLDYRGLIPKGLALEAKEGMYIKTYKN